MLVTVQSVSCVHSRVMMYTVSVMMYTVGVMMYTVSVMMYTVGVMMYTVSVMCTQSGHDVHSQCHVYTVGS